MSPQTQGVSQRWISAVIVVILAGAGAYFALTKARNQTPPSSSSNVQNIANTSQPTVNTAPSVSQTTVFVNTEVGYQITYPSGWSKTTVPTLTNEVATAYYFTPGNGGIITFSVLQKNFDVPATYFGEGGAPNAIRSTINGMSADKYVITSEKDSATTVLYVIHGTKNTYLVSGKTAETDTLATGIKEL